MTKNQKKSLSFDQNKHKRKFERIKIFLFITSNSFKNFLKSGHEVWLLSMNHSSNTLVIYSNLFHIFRAPDTKTNIRRSKTISIKMTDLFSVLAIGSIIPSHTLIFRKYRNKEVSRSNYQIKMEWAKNERSKC